MTARPARNLPDDVFVNHDDAQGSYSVRTTHQPARNPNPHGLATLQEFNYRNLDANRALYPPACDTAIVTKDSPLPAHDQIRFETRTVSPSPPSSAHASANPSPSPPVEYLPFPLAYHHNPLSISTDIPSASPRRSGSLSSRNGSLAASQHGLALQRKTSSSNLHPIQRTPSWKQHFSKGLSSAASSAYPSPVISAMGDVTPLPSPLLSSDSPGPWRRLAPPTPSKELTVPATMPDSVIVTKAGESVAAALENQTKRKAYVGLQVGYAVEHSSGKHEHARNRSISEYVPDTKGIPRRMNTVSARKGDDPAGLRREPRLCESRGLTIGSKPPTPPPSESSQSNDSNSIKKPSYEYFEAHGRKDGIMRRWRAIKDLGEGTFSRVVLATSKIDDKDTTDEDDGARVGVKPVARAVSQFDRKTLVAIKICEHGPKGGASEDRIEMSLKRELDILQSVDHPSLVHLKAWEIEPTRALLVLNYSPGGDLFDVALNYRDSLKAPALRRIFSEIVGAVDYLHQRRIVHRDIKLENVLVNISPAELINPTQDWTTYPHPVVTLTDLGLSRRVADDEKLETRCGSDDYAAPEVILGQSYDGRATDAWSLGVLLYALIESRLPFDPPPGASDYQRMRSRTSHRIARVEWSWIKYAGEDGDHDANLALFEKDGLKGAMEITEGLLRRARSRWPMKQATTHEWVHGAMQVAGGLKFPEMDDGQEVL